MKLKGIRLLIVVALLPTASLMAQTQRQGGGQGFNVAQMVEAEKKYVLDSIATLTEDQKAVIEMIYADYTESFAKIREESNGDFQAMRSKMVALREEKDNSMKEVLTEDQFTKYTALIEKLRQRRTRGN